MRLLGIDYGRKRLGLATCGPLKITSPVGMIVRKNQAEDMANLAEFLEDVQTIVVGCPKHMNASYGEMAQEAEQFAKMVQDHFHLPVVMWDERLTTRQADRSMHAANLSRAQKDKSRDQIAAALMLQSYVDCKKPFSSQGQEK